MYRKFFFTFVFLFICLSNHAQLHSKVDERFELTSIVFRLAGAAEFENNELKTYATDIDKYFQPYKKMAYIDQIKKIRAEYGIGFDAISNLTCMITIQKGKITLAKDANIDMLITTDKRWNKETIDKFIVLLNNFYRQSKFNVFFDNHKHLYAESEKRFDEMLAASVRPEWFESFFGESLGNPEIIISLCNGHNNYSFKKYLTDKTENGIVVGCSQIDEDEIPNFTSHIDNQGIIYYNSFLTQVIIHELSHIFTNPIIAHNSNKMGDAVHKIFPFISEMLKTGNYTEESILNESFNALFTNMYFKQYPILLKDYFIRDDVQKGFLWMYRAISFMDNFSKNRDLYPHINDFMPQLVSFFNEQSNQINILIDEYNCLFLYVVNSFPVKHSSVPVDIKEIVIEFSQPLRAYGTSKTDNPDLLMPYVEANKIYQTDDDMKLHIPISNLEKGKKYGIVIPKAVQSMRGFTMKNDFILIFETTF